MPRARPFDRAPAGEPLLPMSEVLLDLIDPLTVGLPDPPDLDIAETLVLLGALAWNVSRIDDVGDRREEIRRIVEASMDPGALETGADSRDHVLDPSELAEVVDALVDRARTLWPDARQEVLDVLVFNNEWGELRVRAFWRLIGDEDAGQRGARRTPRRRSTKWSKESKR